MINAWDEEGHVDKLFGPNPRSACFTRERMPMATTKKRVYKTPMAVSHTHLLTTHQVMDMLGVSRVTLHYMMRDRGLPYIKLGRSRSSGVRFNMTSVEKWLAQNER